MKKLLRPVAYLIVIIVLYLYFGVGPKRARCDAYHYFLRIYFKGVVANKEIDYANHSYPLVHIQELGDDSQVILNVALDTTDFFQKVKVNDTISKDFNSPWIYKKEKGVFVKYKIIDCGCKIK
jgi:hypothetical protein